MKWQVTIEIGGEKLWTIFMKCRIFEQFTGLNVNMCQVLAWVGEWVTVYNFTVLDFDVFDFGMWKLLVFMVQEIMSITTPCSMIDISFLKTIKKWKGALRYMFILTGKMTPLQMHFCLWILNLGVITRVKVTSRRSLWKVISLPMILLRRIFSFCLSQLQGCGMTPELAWEVSKTL